VIVGSVQDGFWIKTEQILTIHRKINTCAIERQVLARPGGTYIRVGRMFGKLGMIDSPDLVSDIPSEIVSTCQIPTDHIFNIGF